MPSFGHLLALRATHRRGARPLAAPAATALLMARRLATSTADQTPTEKRLVAAASAPADADISPFLLDLLQPPETISLEDATRTYSTMDVVPPMVKFDPLSENVTAPLEEGEEEVEGPVRAAQAAGQLWRTFATATPEEKAANRPPKWFEALCRDLFFRESAEGEAQTAKSITAEDPARYTAEEGEGSAEETERINLFSFLPFDLIDEKDYAIGPYTFQPTATYTVEERVKLCGGDRQKEYVHFCNTYPFPERYQIPTSLGTVPAKLFVDPASPTPLVYVQLSEDFPPALWLPVKPTAAAVRRVLGAYAAMAALHAQRHHEGYERRYEEARRVMTLQQLPVEDEGDVLRFMAYEARNVSYPDAPVREFANAQTFFLGEHDDPERLLEHLDLCPTLFSICPMRTVTNLHQEHMVPTIEGPGVAPSLYRCIYSKALLLVQVQLSAEVKLPPQDPEAFRFMWKDSQVVPKMKVPVFVRVLWPDNERLCAGGLLSRRFNHLFGTEFAPDIPPDALFSLYYAMSWAKALPDLLGVRGMRRRLAELELASTQPEPPLLYPGTRELPNPEYTVQERLGMHVQYLSQLGDPLIAQTIEQLLPTASAPVRMGCAKAALIAGERELFRRIVANEPPGRMQTYMTKLVRKRKTRDLVDPEPRLLDDQYEFAAPLWTKKGTRMDPNTLEGAVDMARARLQR